MNKPKLLFVLSRFPFPLEKGDKLRAFQHLKILSKSYEISLVAISDYVISDADKSRVQPYCARITIVRHNIFQIVGNLISGIIKGLPLQVAYFYSDAARNTVKKEANAFNPDVLYCQLIRTALFAKEVKCNHKVIDYQDAFSEGTRQRVTTAPWILKPIFRRELRTVLKFELETYHWFNKHLIISENDRKMIPVGREKDILVVPNGIETPGLNTGIEVSPIDILFVGNMQYPPNIIAATMLVQQIMPLVWEKRSDVTVTLCGAQPVKSIRDLAGKNVNVTGWVDEVWPYYRAAKLFVAPMQTGIGLQNKLLEAMATGIACITSPLSASPLNGNAKSDYLVATNPQEYASQILELLEDKNKRMQIAVNGQRLISNTFSIQAISKQLQEAIK